MLFLVFQIVLLFKARETKQSRGIWLPTLLSLPFVFYIISLSYTTNVAEGYKYVERSMLLFVLPWILYFNRQTVHSDTIYKTLRLFALVMTGLTVYAFASLIMSNTFQQALSSVNAYYYIRTELELVTGLHPTYFSLFLTLPLLAIQYELKQRRLSLRLKAVAYPMALVLIAGLLLASSKMIMLAAFVGSVIIFSQGLSFKALAVRVLILGGALALMAVTIKPVRERVVTLVLATTQSGVEENNPDSLRKGIYKSVVEAIGENMWIGTGIGDYQAALNAKYEKYGYTIALERNFNTHNQYLQLWLSVGFLPFLIFIASLVAQLGIAISCKHRLHTAFITLMALSFLTENVLARQDGIFFYSFFSSLFCYASWSKHRGKVFINGKFIDQPVTGVQRFAHEISVQLLNHGTKTHLISPVKSNLNSIVLSFAGVKGSLWEQVALPLYLKFCGSPLLVNLGNSAPIAYRNQIITLHDVAFTKHPNWFSNNFIKWYSFMIPRIIRNSKHIFTVSEFSKREIASQFEVEEQKISVSYNGTPTLPQPSENAPAKIEGDYALCVGSLSERKNQLALVKAYLSIPNPAFKLVLAGQHNPDLFNNQKDLLNTIQNSQNIVFIENPDDQELADLYTYASFTVYVPLYEGFGIPVLESITYKKPIVLSDIAVFRELFDDIALFSSVENNDHLRAKLEEMYNSVGKWQNKIDQYDLNEKGYSYKKSAEKMLEIIQSQKKKLENSNETDS